MRTVTTTELLKDWQKLAEEAQREPLHVVGEGVPEAILLSRAQYDRMRGAGRAKLQTSLQRLHDEVRASGFSEQEIEDLIRDDD